MAGGAKKWVELGGGFSMPVKAGGEGEERGRERGEKVAADVGGFQSYVSGGGGRGMRSR